MRQLIGNCKFSFEKGYDEILMSNLFERLNVVDEYLDAVAIYKFNQITNEETLVINEIHFRKSFNI